MLGDPPLYRLIFMTQVFLNPSSWMQPALASLATCFSKTQSKVVKAGVAGRVKFQ